MRDQKKSSKTSRRSKLILLVIFLLFAAIQARLFYWQVVKGQELEDAAQNQSQRLLIKQGKRGKIYTADSHLLVGNQETFNLYFEPEKLTIDKNKLVDALVPIIFEDKEAIYQFTIDDLDQERIELTNRLLNKLNKNNKWILLESKISANAKDKIEELEIAGLQFESYDTRYYPEASMAAHITGFIGKDNDGHDLGYFGVEGALNKELSGKEKQIVINTDALGYQLLGENISNTPADGRDITLTIRRDLQYLSETMLEEGIEKYGAKSGEIIIMEPKTGKILALATYPKYNQKIYFATDTSLFKNPSLTHIYEPGSTFKILTVASGIDAGAITAETECDRCAGPRVIDGYTIKTWNEDYHPNINMSDALAKSDNVAMIFIAERIGAKKFREYLKNFGIGQATNVDLQEDISTPFPDRWYPVELATASFGQGISTTSLQLTKAVAVIANEGAKMKPIIIEKVVDHENNEEIISQPIIEKPVISKKTAQQVTKMMIHSADYGEAQWTASDDHIIAGKTGTSQVAVKGGYDKEKTITSFIGFAPAYDPQFLMLVKLVEPSSSPWAAETAAPLWYKIADRIFLLLNIPTDQKQID
jgi:cell division protein FtsI (penicillin-binding protein 3)